MGEEEVNHWLEEYGKLKEDKAASFEDILPSQHNQPSDVSKLGRKCRECGHSLPDLPPPIPKEPWTTGIFDCAQDKETCLRGLFCPCVLYGQNLAMFKQPMGNTTCILPCICHAICVEGCIGLSLAVTIRALLGITPPGTAINICSVLPFFLCGVGLCNGFLRESFSKKYHLENSPCGPVCVQLCMHWCALCQEHKELKVRLSADASVPMTAVYPPPVQKMNVVGVAPDEQVNVEVQDL